MSLVSLRSTNFPTLFIRHRDFLGEVSAIASNLDKQDGSFFLIPGLADRRLISFQSVNFPDHFLRHQDFRLKLSPEPKNMSPSDPFFLDATFEKVPGLADATATSFRSLNFPDRFIRHRNFKLFVEPQTSPNLAPDATFKLEQPFVHVDESKLTFTTGSLTSSHPLGGTASLTIERTGAFTFSTHAHDSGFDNIRYSLGAVLLTPSALGFSFGHAGHLEGTSGGGLSPDRNDDFTTSGSNPVLAEQFDRLRGAKFAGALDGTDVLVDGIKQMIEQVLRDVLKELGQAAVKGLISLV